MKKIRCSLDGRSWASPAALREVGASVKDARAQSEATQPPAGVREYVRRSNRVPRLTKGVQLRFRHDAMMADGHWHLAVCRCASADYKADYKKGAPAAL